MKQEKIGYGCACLGGFKVTKGKYIILADADGWRNLKFMLKTLKIKEK